MSKSSAAKKSEFPAGNYAPHQLSNLVPGEMSDEEFTALCTSIKEHGLADKIVLFEDQILDGRHRHQALAKLGIKYSPLHYEKFTGSAQEAANLVLDHNLQRRQLNSMQKALVAARMCERNEAPLPQKDAAAKVGVGVATVNLAVRLLKSNNTPLIKRCENGDATRSEIDELLYDREASRAQEQVGKVEEQSGGSEDDVEDGNAITAPGGKASKNNVHELRPGSIVGKRGHPERRAQETSVSRCVGHFKALSEKDKVQFCVLAHSWLEPAMQAAAKLPKPNAGGKPLSAEKIAKAKGGKPSKGKAKK